MISTEDLAAHSDGTIQFDSAGDDDNDSSGVFFTSTGNDNDYNIPLTEVGAGTVIKKEHELMGEQPDTEKEKNVHKILKSTFPEHNDMSESIANEIRRDDLGNWWNSADLQERADVVTLAGGDPSQANEDEWDMLDNYLQQRIEEQLLGEAPTDYGAKSGLGQQISPNTNARQMEKGGYYDLHDMGNQPLDDHDGLYGESLQGADGSPYEEWNKKRQQIEDDKIMTDMEREDWSEDMFREQPSNYTQDGIKKAMKDPDYDKIEDWRVGGEANTIEQQLDFISDSFTDINDEESQCNYCGFSETEPQEQFDHIRYSHPKIYQKELGEARASEGIGRYDIYDYDGNLVASNLSNYDATHRATGDQIVVDSDGNDVSGAFGVSLNHKTYTQSDSKYNRHANQYKESVATEDFEQSSADSFDTDDIFPEDPEGDDFRENSYLSKQHYDMSESEMRSEYVNTMKEALERILNDYGVGEANRLFDFWTQNTAMFNMPNSTRNSPEGISAFESAYDEVGNWLKQQIQSQKATMPDPSWESLASERLTPEQERAFRLSQKSDNKFDPLWNMTGKLGDDPKFDDARKEYEQFRKGQPAEDYQAIQDLDLFGMVKNTPTNDYMDYSAGSPDEAKDPTYYSEPTSAGLGWQERTKPKDYDSYWGDDGRPSRESKANEDWRPQHIIDAMADMTSRFNDNSDYDEMVDYAMATFNMSGREASSLTDSALDEMGDGMGGGYESKANEASIKQTLSDLGITRAEAERIADSAGGGLKEIIAAGNFEELYYNYKEESAYLMKEAEDEFASYTDKDFENMGLQKDANGDYTELSDSGKADDYARQLRKGGYMFESYYKGDECQICSIDVEVVQGHEHSAHLEMNHGIKKKASVENDWEHDSSVDIDNDKEDIDQYAIADQQNDDDKIEQHWRESKENIDCPVCEKELVPTGNYDDEGELWLHLQTDHNQTEEQAEDTMNYGVTGDGNGTEGAHGSGRKAHKPWMNEITKGIETIPDEDMTTANIMDI